MLTVITLVTRLETFFPPEHLRAGKDILSKQAPSQQHAFPFSQLEARYEPSPTHTREDVSRSRR